MSPANRSPATNRPSYSSDATACGESPSARKTPGFAGAPEGLAPAGRLDIDSTGLLVLTQDGRIARQLIGDDSEVEKEYLVRVSGTLIEGGLRLLNHGLSLDGRVPRPARVSWQNEDQLCFILKEGRKRQIRRMCELVGLRVTGLKRPHRTRAAGRPAARQMALPARRRAVLNDAQNKL